MEKRPKFKCENCDSGSLEIEICEAGGERLIKVEFPMDMKINPNPASNKITIKAFLLETGKHRLQISDLNGRKTVLKKWTVGSGTEKKMDIEVDLSDFTSGFYYISIYSPNLVKVKPIMIMK